MARMITQETFNEVVRENMEEFDMSQEEAIAEARKQFQAQVCYHSSFFCFFRLQTFFFLTGCKSW